MHTSDDEWALPPRNWKNLADPQHGYPDNIIPLVLGPMFTSGDKVEVFISGLQGARARTFVNSIHKICFAFPPSDGRTI